MTKLIIAALFTALFTAALPAFAADLTIQVDGVASDQGQVMVAVFNSADTFPSKALRAVTVPARSGKVQLRIDGLPAGEYALAVYHDANGNGKLDRNLMGMPTEDYGFSNNALGKRGAPSYADARIVLPDGGATTSVNLH
ncbi:DUF2141 domain-containing protein [Duganella sp. FT80W]|uniref:DUF2141 domain-containing protein n=1 Tax=Duganella guangzhouensis TaxID=2666084 RepID=A0A6I2KUR3_9BURK|nr:DUF2141 domain-containing protein [Duganella guangzhouensis]MRW89628.1 DUF2141 domain-containing protein [Duganella guangzhouensis]